MATPVLPPVLTIAVSSRALFHMEDGNQIWEKKGQAAFNAYMREKENEPLRAGTAFPLVRKLLALNKNQERSLVNVVILSRNSPDAGVRILKSIQHHKLPIAQAMFSQGSDRFRYVSAVGAHLFLSGNHTDVHKAISNGIAAATITPKETVHMEDPSIKIAFDGDSVLFGSESDDAYRSLGLDHFISHEHEKRSIPMEGGPFKGFVMALKQVQDAFPAGECPLKLALVTARGIQSHERVFTTLRDWGLSLDEVMFCGGTAKGPILKAFGADIFFDDTQSNLNSALDHDISSGHVPFGAGGIPGGPSGH